MLRIIAGDLKGKKLFSVKGQHTRPTSDRLRESIFNILTNRSKNAFALDLYAGTGALGIEALSRGATLAYFIDNHKESISLISKNIQSCRLEDRCRIFRWDIERNLRCLKNLTNTFNLIFMDPPYNANLIKPTLSNLEKSGCLKSDAWIVIEHSTRETIPADFQSFTRIDQRKYGKVFLSIYSFGR